MTELNETSLSRAEPELFSRVHKGEGAFFFLSVSFPTLYLFFSPQITVGRGRFWKYKMVKVSGSSIFQGVIRKERDLAGFGD